MTDIVVSCTDTHRVLVRTSGRFLKQAPVKLWHFTSRQRKILPHGMQGLFQSVEPLTHLRNLFSPTKDLFSRAVWIAVFECVWVLGNGRWSKACPLKKFSTCTPGVVSNKSHTQIQEAKFSFLELGFISIYFVLVWIGQSNSAVRSGKWVER